MVPPVPYWVILGWATEAFGVKVWAELPVNCKVPVPAVKEERGERSTDVGCTCSVEEPKFNPPPVTERVVVTKLVNAVPRFSVPFAMVKVGAVNPKVVTVVPPVPFCLRFKVVMPALELNVCGEEPVNSKVLLPDAVTVTLAKLIEVPDTARFEVPKSRLAEPEIFPALWLNPEPRLSVPLERVKLPAVKALEEMVVPPAPFWTIAGKAAPALG